MERLSGSGAPAQRPPPLPDAGHPPPIGDLSIFPPTADRVNDIEIEFLRQHDRHRGAVISAMDKIGQIRAGQNVDSTAVLATHGKQLSECRSRKPHRTV